MQAFWAVVTSTPFGPPPFANEAAVAKVDAIRSDIIRARAGPRPSAPDGGAPRAVRPARLMMDLLREEGLQDERYTPASLEAAALIFIDRRVRGVPGVRGVEVATALGDCSALAAGLRRVGLVASAYLGPAPRDYALTRGAG